MDENLSCMICYDKILTASSLSRSNDSPAGIQPDSEQYKINCCKAIICKVCISYLDDYRCPFCRQDIESLKLDYKYNLSRSCPSSQSFQVLNNYQSRDNIFVEIIRNRRKKDRTNRKNAHNGTVSSSYTNKYNGPFHDASYHAKNRDSLQNQIKEDIEIYNNGKNSIHSVFSSESLYSSNLFDSQLMNSQLMDSQLFNEISIDDNNNDINDGNDVNDDDGFIFKLDEDS